MAFRPHPQRRPVLIAGASSGIGAATAEYLAAAGHPVALAARRVEKLQELADKITTAGGEAVAVPLDVTDEQSVIDCVAKAQAALGDLEIVVAGAGDLAIGLSYETGTQHFADQVNIHLNGAYRIYRAAIRGMIDRARGDFVFIGSDVAAHPRPWSSAYVAAKSGIDGLVATIQLELEGTGVRAGVVRPGQTITGMGMNLDATATENMLNDWIAHGLARHGNFLAPEHIAQAVAAMVTMPRGAHMRSVDVEAEGAVSDNKRQATQEKGTDR
ncbi:SDR family oxidoreductase [Gordonia sp. 'Campus']|jgi:NADP-dependent 3-hydroxy acid dehydrogenase YdfG|uniref:SDR family oxidoreductase n=1 Tax=Gordonia sp. 'Campus' TaxID=2915824 RepID=UPI001EE49EDD|nr:SDR family oxidoreductase [Gordonia sp. 'Campus']